MGWLDFEWQPPLANHVFPLTGTDPDGVELGKLLEMKGLKRSEQAAFLDIFQETKPQVRIVTSRANYFNRYRLSLTDNISVVS